MIAHAKNGMGGVGRRENPQVMIRCDVLKGRGVQKFAFLLL